MTTPGATEAVTPPTPEEIAYVLYDAVRHMRPAEARAEIAKQLREAEVNALRRAAERYVPRLMFSADDGGTLSLHWRFENGGVLVVFSGDEMAHISIKASPAEQYSMNGEDALIDGALHDKIVSAIRSLLPKEEGK